MKVFQIPVGPMQNFVYLVMDEESRVAIAIDSGWETEPIVSIASKERMKVRYVCATHGHFDHVKSLDKLASELGATTVSFKSPEIEPALEVRDGSVLKLGEGSVRVIHTPGHTRDSVCYFDGEHLFTGDTLIIGAWGRTDLPGGSAAQLFSSLHDIVMKLPGSTILYAGHDYGDVPFRTLAEESKRNPALLARSSREFVGLTQD
jgi:hydroxyacylglutathione hydrolase